MVTPDEDTAYGPLMREHDATQHDLMTGPTDEETEQ